MSILTFRGQWVQHLRAVVIQTWTLSTHLSMYQYQILYQILSVPDSAFSVWYLSPYAGRTLYLTLDGFTLSVRADCRQLEWSSPLRSTSSLYTGPQYTISEDCLWVTFSSQSIVPQANIAPLFIKCNIISPLLSLPARPFDVKSAL